MQKNHQRSQRTFGAMGAPALQLYAWANGSNCERAPITRNLLGGCSSVRIDALALFSRVFSHHVCPIATKKSRFALLSGWCLATKASHENLSPPLSAIDSPSVNLPFTGSPYISYDEKRSEMHLARVLKLATTCGVHQPLRFPSPSYSRPTSSKPCVISWPQMAPTLVNVLESQHICVWVCIYIGI